MRKSLLFVFCFCLLSFAQWPVTRVQRAWNGGPGQVWVNNNWGIRYRSATGFSDAVPPLIIQADPASYVYTNWAPHVIDNSPEVATFTWCVRTADIDRDGYIDIVANLQDENESGTGYVVWYKGPSSGWTYTRNNIYTYSANDRCSGAFPADIDNDGDIDIVAASNTSLAWFENNGSGGGWTRRVIYTTSESEYHAWYYDVADADGDGWKDILLTELEGNTLLGFYAYTTIYWGNATPPVHYDGTYTLVSSFGRDDGMFWRAVFLDADPTDGFLDVAYERINFGLLGGADQDSLIIATQGPARTFTRRYAHVINAAANGTGHDGLWANDYDDDGDQDIVCAVADNDCATILGCNDPGYFFLVRSDPGDVFTYQFLVSDPQSSYGDGAIMFDMDNDGTTDIVGTCDSLGYYRRVGAAFTLYKIDNIPGTGFQTHYASHWVYPYNLDRGECSGDADIDMIVTYDNGTEEAIKIYENYIFSFLPSATMYSSILGIPLPRDTCVVCSLYWDGCYLPNYTINISGRAGTTIAQCSTAAFGTPATIPWSESGGNHGWYVGTFRLPIDTLWVQYYISLTRTGGSAQLSPLIDSVWVKVFPIPCECESIRAQWICPPCAGIFSSCPNQTMTIVLWTDSTTIDTNRVYFTVNNGAGSIFPISNLTHPNNISFTCLPPPRCDSIMVEVSGFTWQDMANVSISLDSAYTLNGCLTRW